MTPLLPCVVLRSDARWVAAVAELRALVEKDKGLCGLDSEFTECPILRAAAEASGRDLKRDDFDPWSTRLRLLQVGLPSGLCMVLDFGPRFGWPTHEDYGSSVPLSHPDYDDVLPLLKRLCESRGISKLGVSLGTEALILRRHFGWTLRRCRDVMLGSQVLWAGVAGKSKRWTQAGLIPQEVLSHGYRAVAGRLGIVIDKEQQGSDWGAEELTAEQYNYAALDVALETLVEIWKRLTEKAKDEGVLDAILVECEAAPAFWECEWRGTPLDAEVCRKLIADYGRAGDELYAQVAAELGIRACEGDGSQQAVAVGLTRWLRARGRNACLYRWERKQEQIDGHGVRRVRTLVAFGTEMTVEEAQPSPPPKPKKPTGKPKPPTRPAKWTKRCTEADYEAKVRAYEVADGEYCRRLYDYQQSLAIYSATAEAPRWTFRPEMGEAALAPYDSEPVVSALLEARSCRSTQRALQKRLSNSWAHGDGRLATRCRYWQIAGGFDSGRGEADGAGGGTGRSSASKPLNNQNVTTYPLGKKRCGELGLGNARECVRVNVPRQMLVGDFSQAHMRFFAQVSQDPNLLDDFRNGRDAHIRLARDFFVAAYPDHPLSARDFDYWCKAYQEGKTHPDFATIKEPRIPAKNGNYSFLNMGGFRKVRQIAETAPEPVHLPATIELNGADCDPWEVIQERWREVYAVGYQYQRRVIREANSEAHTFDFCEGEYGACWSADGKRRLYLIKEWNVPQWAESPEDGRWSVKGTDVLAGVMQMSEAQALKIALALIQAEFDAHPEWAAFIFNVVHDEIDAECAYEYRLQVAECVHRWMQEGLRRAGLVDLPCAAPDDTAEKLLVGSWAEK